MKIIIALILAFVLCFGLSACGDPSVEATKDGESTTKGNNNSGILDLCKEWHSLSYYTSISFNTEDSCTFGETECKYDYDEEKGIISIYAMYTLNLNVVIDGDVLLLKMEDVTFVPLAAYEKYDEAYLDAYIENHWLLSVASDNLAPTLQKGDSAFFRPVGDPSKLSVGDVISYWTVIEGARVINIGQIVEITDSEGGIFGLIMKEDVESAISELSLMSPEVIGTLEQVIDAS